MPPTAGVMPNPRPRPAARRPAASCGHRGPAEPPRQSHYGAREPGHSRPPLPLPVFERVSGPWDPQVRPILNLLAPAPRPLAHAAIIDFAGTPPPAVSATQQPYV